MYKKGKILLMLLLLSLLVVGYLIISSKRAKITRTNETRDIQTSEQVYYVNMKELEHKYKEEFKLLLTDCEKYLTQDDITIEQVVATKNKLLELKVPTKFKELHLKLVLALIRVENFLADGNAEEKLISLEMVKQIRDNYEWIN